ncbi:WD40 repeat domain-containing protein, partial [Aspergillus fijiensis CBS 313.89]
MTTPQTKPPATPTYILRGHAAQIHSLHIYHHNLRLVSGDADGWIAVWDLVSKRPIAVWKAHDGAVLGVYARFRGDGSSGVTEVFTHGRDHKLRVWRFSVAEEVDLRRGLPVDSLGVAASTGPPAETGGEAGQGAGAGAGAGRQPWLVHSLPVNALNFCAFAWVDLPALLSGPVAVPSDGDGDGDGGAEAEPEPPSRDKSPSPVLIAVPNALNSGAIDLFHLPTERRVCTIPADGEVKTGMVMALTLFLSPEGRDLHVAAAYEDGSVMVFRSPVPFQGLGPQQQQQQGLAAGSWKWEKLYASRAHDQPVLSIDAAPSGEWVFSSAADAKVVMHPFLRKAGAGGLAREQPAKVVKTRHAGQQGLRVRSDGRILATAGWDSRVRVYSCKTLKEVAVLKWHREGCYAV